MRRDPIAEFLAQREVIILDGALASELERRGADLHDPLWSAKVLLEEPSLIRAVHRDYFEAGADVATTATYQASFEGFQRRGIDARRAAALMRQAVTLALEARAAFWSEPSRRTDRLRPLIVASLGPYGAMLADGSEYRGGYGVSDAVLMAFHRSRMEILLQSGADLLGCETLPSLSEALAIARVLQSFPDASAWISFCCRDGERTCEGQPIGECIERLNEFPQIVSIGVNCTAPQFISPLLDRMREHTDKPLLVYPNSGERYEPLTQRWVGRAEAAPLAAQARHWQQQGARLIGGCCRTTPQDIRSLRQELLPCA